MQRFMSLVLVPTLILGLSSQPTLAQAAPKVKVIKVKLPNGGTTTVKGTKAQIFKVAEQEAKKRDSLLNELEKIEDCEQEDCSQIEQKIENSEKIIDVITKSLYTKAADASMLTPITKAEYRFFANQVKQEINYIEADIKEIQDMKNTSLNSFLASFESSFAYKGGWTKDAYTQMIIGNLQSNLKFFYKVLGGFERSSRDGNPEGIVEVNISRRQSVQEIIDMTEQNFEDSLTGKNVRK